MNQKCIMLLPIVALFICIAYLLANRYRFNWWNHCQYHKQHYWHSLSPYFLDNATECAPRFLLSLLLLLLLLFWSHPEIPTMLFCIYYCYRCNEKCKNIVCIVCPYSSPFIQTTNMLYPNKLCTVNRRRRMTGYKKKKKQEHIFI